MINFRDRSEFFPSLVSLAAILVLAGSVIVELLPAKTPDDLNPAKVRNARFKIQIATKEAQERKTEGQAVVDRYTWAGPVQDIGTESLRRVNALSRKHNVKLTAFRPQPRQGQVDDLVTLNYTLNIEGTCPDVLAFERELESPDTKLAVNLVQFSSSDVNTNKVTANIGIVAYLNPGGGVLDTSKEKTNRA